MAWLGIRWCDGNVEKPMTLCDDQRSRREKRPPTTATPQQVSVLWTVKSGDDVGTTGTVCGQLCLGLLG